METEGKLLNEARPELWRNLYGNEFLVAVPEPRKYSEIRPLLLSSAFDLHLHDRGSICFPIFTTEADSAPSLFEANAAPAKPRSNLNESLWASLKRHWHLEGDLYGADALSLGARIARLCMAICHSPAYEDEHKESLAQDWAHVPIPKDRALFEQLAAMGNRIGALLDPLRNVDLILSEILQGEQNTLAVLRRRGGGSVRQAELVVGYSFFGNAGGGWRMPASDADLSDSGATVEPAGDLYINDEIYFQNVPLAVWTYELGGYPVLKKWLAYRDNGRRPNTALSIRESEHVQSMVRRIAALLALHAQLDSLYETAALNSFSLEELALS